MKNSFANKVRKIIKAQAGLSVRIAETAKTMGLVSDADKRPLYGALIDMRKSGEITRIARGKYKWAEKQTDKSQIREIMWRFFRAKRTISVEDLQEIAGAKKTYASEWLRMLCRNDIARKAGRKYIMIKDPVAMPDDDEKAERLRKLRKSKTLAALNEAEIAIKKAREMVRSD